MGYCPKCGRKVKRRRKSTGVRECKKHGPIEKSPMKETIEMTVPDSGEVFTHKDDDGTIRVFAVCLMREFAKNHIQECNLVKKVSIPVTIDNVNHARNKMGVEQDRLDRLCDPYLHEPIISIVWPDNRAGNETVAVTIIDGQHRLVKLWELGERTAENYVFHHLIWEQFLLDVPDAEKRLVMPSGMLEYERNQNLEIGS